VEKSQSRQLADLPPQVREQGGVLAVAAAFRGARATVSGRDGTATGRIVGVEQIEIPGKGPDVPPAREWRLTLLVDGETLRTFRLAEVRSLKILDKSLSVGLAKALDATLNEASWKPIELTIELAGRSPHDIAVSYVVEMPTWKPAYRVVVADAGQVHNEAIVTPETVDAIRAMTGLESDGARSIAKTDAALGIRKDLLVWGGAR